MICLSLIVVYDRVSKRFVWQSVVENNLEVPRALTIIKSKLVPEVIEDCDPWLVHIRPYELHEEKAEVLQLSWSTLDIVR